VYICEFRPRKDRRGVDLISDVSPLGRLWYGEANAILNGLWLSLVERLVRDDSRLIFSMNPDVLGRAQP
jgi:hypothetical protein